MYYTYVLKSLVKNRFYVGITNDITRRLIEHNKKKTKSTRFYAPWELLLFEKFESRFEARVREKYLKSGIGKEYIKNMAR